MNVAIAPTAVPMASPSALKTTANLAIAKIDTANVPTNPNTGPNTSSNELYGARLICNALAIVLNFSANASVPSVKSSTAPCESPNAEDIAVISEKIENLESKSVDTSGIGKNAEAIADVDKKATVNEKTLQLFKLEIEELKLKAKNPLAN